MIEIPDFDQGSPGTSSDFNTYWVFPFSTYLTSNFGLRLLGLINHSSSLGTTWITTLVYNCCAGRTYKNVELVNLPPAIKAQRVETNDVFTQIADLYAEAQRSFMLDWRSVWADMRVSGSRENCTDPLVQASKLGQTATLGRWRGLLPL